MRSQVTAVTRRKSALGLVGAVALVATAVVMSPKRRDSSACPLALRNFLHVPRPLISRERVLRMLAPVPGQHVLEIGPGAGYYSLELATALTPDGVLDLLDIHEPMLQTVTHRAAERGVTSITPHQGDAQACPFPDATFEAVLTVATLGKIPDPVLALREMHRVLKPTGRLIVAEGQPDPHMVTRAAMADLADSAGFTIVQWEGNALGYAARLEPRSAS